MTQDQTIFDKLKKRKKPRVHVTYEVEKEGAMLQKQIPFVAGVIGDFIGNHSETSLTPLSERKFAQIDEENFNDIMEKFKPGLSFTTNNTLSPEISETLAVELKFRSIQDFEPTAIVKQIQPLDDLLNTRNELMDLMSKSDRSLDIEKFLEEVLSQSDINA